MSEPQSDTAPWRTRVRAVVLHPHLPLALALRVEGRLALPEFELPGRVWSGRPQRFVRAVRDLIGVEVALLRSAAERADHDDLVLHTTLVFVLRDPSRTGPGG